MVKLRLLPIVAAALTARKGDIAAATTRESRMDILADINDTAGLLVASTKPGDTPEERQPIMFPNPNGGDPIQAHEVGVTEVASVGLRSRERSRTSFVRGLPGELLNKLFRMGDVVTENSFDAAGKRTGSLAVVVPGTLVRVEMSRNELEQLGAEFGDSSAWLTKEIADTLRQSGSDYAALGTDSLRAMTAQDGTTPILAPDGSQVFFADIYSDREGVADSIIDNKVLGAAAPANSAAVQGAGAASTRSGRGSRNANKTGLAAGVNA